MPNYRVYQLDENARIVARHEVSCDSDEAAQSAAAKLVPPGTQAEVWEGARLLGRVSARDVRKSLLEKIVHGAALSARTASAARSFLSLFRSRW